MVSAGRVAAAAGDSGRLAKFGWSRKNDMFQVCFCARAVFVCLSARTVFVVA